MGSDVIDTGRCQNCGRIVSFRKGSTIRIHTKSSWRKEYPDRPARVHLCSKCADKLPEYRKTQWYESDEIV